MAFDRTRTARGALAGAFAAGVWAAQQPLDKAVFGSSYDDTELLGKAVTRGPSWMPIGAGPACGQRRGVRRRVREPGSALPLPPWARGPAAGLAENVGLWPLGRLSDRFHPARDELETLTGNRRALAQASWRHLLFGVVLGELERRLNRPEEDVPPPYEALVSPNGHGRIEHAVAAGTADEVGGSSES